MFIGTGNTDHKYVNPININDPSSYKRTVIANNLSLEYRNEHVILSSTTGHQYFKDDMKMDQDFSPLSIFTLNQKQKQNAFSEELAIKSNTRNNYQWSFGLYGSTMIYIRTARSISRKTELRPFSSPYSIN